jgi:hypothetical protein
MVRRRGDQPIERSRGLDLVAPAERLDDALHVATALARVLDEVEIFVGSNLLDADEHGATPCSRQGTNLNCDCPTYLAPQLGARPIVSLAFLRLSAPALVKTAEAGLDSIWREPPPRFRYVTLWSEPCLASLSTTDC